MIDKIRNFCIIAHIDHWKSTLADRMLEITHTVSKLDWTQVLDWMDLEKERWITIKLTPVRMNYKWYELNLIDTPWHVDFQYEVSRSLASVEWAILLVDVTQWIQAQTLSNLYLAMENDLKIIVALNKVDIKNVNIEIVENEIYNLIWIEKKDILRVSWKSWLNVDRLLDEVISKIDDPLTHKKKFLKNFYKENFIFDTYNWQFCRALIFDSVYDKYKWVVLYVKIVDWDFYPHKEYIFLNKWIKIYSTEVGFFNIDYKKCDCLKEWQIWYIVTWQKNLRDAQIWDSIFWSNEIKIDEKNSKNYVIPWFKKINPFVYSWVYPLDSDEYEKLKISIEKLCLNDSAVEYEYENSRSLWHWFRCWFLWTLHMDIIKERLKREYMVETIFTIPNVIYLLKLKNTNHEKIKSWMNISDIKNLWLKKIIFQIENLQNENENEKVLQNRIVAKSWADFPESHFIDEIYEPFCVVEIIWPSEYSWNIMELCTDYRWVMKQMKYIDTTRILWEYEMPLWEVIIDFYDRLKSLTKWFATLSYNFKWYLNSDLIRLDIYINNEMIETFSSVVAKEKSFYIWRNITEKLKELIPKQLFPIPIQAFIWSKAIARETISAIKKDVLAKCYWWDITRKRKLLEKQKEWKKRLKQMWKISIPNDIFIKMISR